MKKDQFTRSIKIFKILFSSIWHVVMLSYRKQDPWWIFCSNKNLTIETRIIYFSKQTIYDQFRMHVGLQHKKFLFFEMNRKSCNVGWLRHHVSQHRLTYRESWFRLLEASMTKCVFYIYDVVYMRCMKP